MTRSPRSSRFRASALPIPDEAPVMSHVRGGVEAEDVMGNPSVLVAFPDRKQGKQVV